MPLQVNGADMAQTHLNLCATLSQLSRHERALYHAQAVLIRMSQPRRALERVAGFRTQDPELDQLGLHGFRPELLLTTE